MIVRFLDLGYAAGLYEGEGTFATKRGRRPDGRRNPAFHISMTDEEPIRWFHEIVGIGRVYGPYRGTIKPYWLWQSMTFEESQALVALFWRWLSPRRKAQASDALRAMSRPIVLKCAEGCQCGRHAQHWRKRRAVTG